MSIIETPNKSDHEDRIIKRAIEILQCRLLVPGAVIEQPSDVKTYLTLRLAERQEETFCCMFFDAQLRLIAFKELFRGTHTECAVYPRVVVKEALLCNAVSVILVHNHPGGSRDPSSRDILLTKNLTDSLRMIDVRVNDHIIVCGTSTFSFSENHLLKMV